MESSSSIVSSSITSILKKVLFLTKDIRNNKYLISRVDNINNNNDRNREDQLTAQIVVDITAKIATVAITLYVSYQGIKIINSFIANQQKSSMTALQLKKNLAKKLNRPEVENMEFSTYEMSIATDVISPQDLQTKFEDIGGMEEQLEDMSVYMYGVVRSLLNRCNEDENKISPELRNIINRVK